MEKHVKEIAEKAGFIMWENEQWKPPGLPHGQHMDPLQGRL